MDDLEMLLYVVCARCVTPGVTPARTLRISAWGARALGWIATRQPAHAQERAERLAWRWVSLVAGGDCYDRAVAARWWLARRSTPVEVVIGVRAGRASGEVEGHAWIEDQAGGVYLMERGAGYREVTRG